MNANTAIWLGVTFVSAILLALFAAKVHSGRRSRTETNRGAWLAAAGSSATMLVFIGAKVIDLIPGGATAIDVCALAITGVLTGLFLAFSLAPRQDQPTEGDAV